MSYLVLARKWRPQTFEAITGQEHVTRTLTHAIEQDRVHHAFLFSGARGVGKTSAARVLARALNCEEGSTGTPCGTCAACTEIAAGTAIDVFEIDGASNRGIGEIRDLREGVAYAPQRDRYKIYIIDEVHMLTTEAFNALLKTLEEPPAHVKFIFATTEPQRIPVTILSRCQRFDFKRIPVKVMTARLQEILVEEGVSIAEGALGLVCRESEGSMRDALSLLDRIISFCGQSATYEAVAEILGVADRAWLAKLVQSTLSHDAQAALAVIDEVVTYGVDLRQFSADLVHYLRDVVVLQVAGADASLTDLTDEERASLADLGKGQAPEDLERLLTLAIRSAERVVDAGFPRLELEMMAIRMSRLRPLRPIDDLVDRLAAIERHLASGAPLPPPGPGSGARVRAEAPAPAAPAAQPAAPAPSPEPSETNAVGAEPAAPAPNHLTLVADAVQAPPTASEAPDAAPQTFVQDDWERFVDLVRGEDAVLAASLDHGQVLDYSDAKLVIGSSRSTHSLESVRLARARVLELLQRHVGALRGFDVQVVEQVNDTPFERRETRRLARLKERREALAAHPAVAAVVARFDGALCRVELVDEEEGRA
ncbi:MAG: DNA polymerase III subunit gamma/tau [Myxococcota bacterium]|jgi:DNA polymerase-3 subunit gamma/tau|nr:DNA polymerase III subunit gamma/tau [Myxococcota bacterium]